MCTEKTKSVISKEEEDNLIKQLRNGDQAAANQLIVVYSPYVVAVAKEYQNQGLDLAELIAEGNEGLLKAAKTYAAQKYDETRGFRFISYAIWWVRQSILQALAHHNKK